ncbi:hypothetical protein BDW62DRAFT_124664 [Aspergillus aurantiobrunneus]
MAWQVYLHSAENHRPTACIPQRRSHTGRTRHALCSKQNAVHISGRQRFDMTPLVMILVRYPQSSQAQFSKSHQVWRRLPLQLWDASSNRHCLRKKGISVLSRALSAKHKILPGFLDMAVLQLALLIAYSGTVPASTNLLLPLCTRRLRVSQCGLLMNTLSSLSIFLDDRWSVICPIIYLPQQLRRILAEKQILSATR